VVHIQEEKNNYLQTIVDGFWGAKQNCCDLTFLFIPKLYPREEKHCPLNSLSISPPLYQVGHQVMISRMVDFQQRSAEW